MIRTATAARHGALRTTLLAGWVLLAVMFVTLATGCDRGGRATPATPVDFAAPDLFSNTSIKLSDFDGDVILVNFWASWCGPCQVEIPGLIELHRRYKDKGVTVIGVAMDDAEDEARQAARQLGIDYPVVRGSDAVSRRFGGIVGFPTTFILDRHRVPVMSYPGLASPRAMEQQILAQIRAPS
ncbi:MAG: TlpA disulfide reductase family protein [bacterium]